jgi:hypothetical protein
MLKKMLGLSLLISSSMAGAHCPTHFKPEKVCLMLDQNVLYIYGEKSEHSGPYQDFKNTTIESIKADGAVLNFTKAARGVYKIEEKKRFTKIDLDLLNDKKKASVTVAVEK